MELRIMVSALVLNYSWNGVPDEPGKWDEEMDPYDYFVFSPRKDKCVLELKVKS